MSSSPALHVSRTAPAQFVARNDRGGTIRVARADVDDAFTPGELLQIALAACGLMSADATLSAKLGDDFVSTAAVTAQPSADGTAYAAIPVRIEVPMDALRPDARASLAGLAERAIEKRCTVGRTLSAGAEHPVSVVARVG